MRYDKASLCQNPFTYILLLLGKKDIACYTEDFVMHKFVKSRFLCIAQEAILMAVVTFTETVSTMIKINCRL